MRHTPRVRRFGLAIGVGASLVAHGAIAAALVSLATARLPRDAERVPLSVVEAPAPPPPPKPPPPAAEPKSSEPPPKPKPRPRPKPKPPPEEVAVTPDGGVPTVADAGVELDATSSADAGDAGRPTDGGAGDGAPLLAQGTGDAGVTGPVDPGVVDLRPLVPEGARAVLLLRTDHLRGTPWAARLEAVIAPMPDYRSLLEGTGLAIAESFDVVVISSPEPRDVSQTFLAARTPQDPAALRRMLDRRKTIPGDPRIIVSPRPSLFLLVRPELVEGAVPVWMPFLDRIDEVTGTGPTIAVVTAARLPDPLSLPIPGLPPLPAPEHLTVAVHTDEHGLVITGAAVFLDEALARAFAEAVEKARVGTLGSLTGKLVLRSLHLEGAVQRLAIARNGGFVTFSTSLTTPEAELVLEQAAQMAHRFFLGEKTP